MMNNASHAARRLTMVLVAVTGLVLAAEAEASDDSEEEASEAEAVFERFNAMSEPQRTEELIEAAQAEGQLNLYGTSSLGDFGEAFSEKYDIEFSLY